MIIKIRNSGYINCKSSFYTVEDILEEYQIFEFSNGINRLNGEIDSGIFAVSYLISMSEYVDKEALLYPLNIEVDGCTVSLKEFSSKTCYMDRSYPLFSSKNTVRKMVEEGIKKNELSLKSEDIRDMFHMDPERFERPISGTGNERFRAMGAIGYCHKKDVFCFPWMSKKRFDGFHGHLTDLLDILASLDKVIILPVGH